MGGANCWESRRCGREPGGPREPELGACPAATEQRLDGVHGGRASGRACWVVAGTLCGGVVAGSFAAKHENCRACSFYDRVLREEGRLFIHSNALRARLGVEPAPLPRYSESEE